MIALFGLAAVTTQTFAKPGLGGIHIGGGGGGFHNGGNLRNGGSVHNGGFQNGGNFHNGGFHNGGIQNSGNFHNGGFQPHSVVSPTPGTSFPHHQTGIGTSGAASFSKATNSTRPGQSMLSSQSSGNKGTISSSLSNVGNSNRSAQAQFGSQKGGAGSKSNTAKTEKRELRKLLGALGGAGGGNGAGGDWNGGGTQSGATVADDDGQPVQTAGDGDGQVIPASADGSGEVVQAAAIGSQEWGMKVTELKANGAAARADLRVGDIIVAVAGKRVQSFDELASALAERNTATEFVFVNSENNKLEKMNITPANGKLGIATEAVVVAEAGAENAAQPAAEEAASEEYGMKVTKVTPNGAAARADLRVGDIIVAVAGQRVQSFDELAAVLAERSSPTEIVIVNGENNKLEKMKIVPVNGKIGVATEATVVE